MKHTVRLLLLMTLAVGAITAYAEKAPRMQRVYMFGFAASFTDSVAYQTDIQRIDSAWLDAHKMLVDRSLYSLQLQYHVESVEGKPNSTSTVFFSPKQKTAERMWKRVRRRYQNAEGLHLTTLPAERFRFMAEEYRPIIVEEDTTAVAPAPAAASKK